MYLLDENIRPLFHFGDIWEQCRVEGSEFIVTFTFPGVTNGNNYSRNRSNSEISAQLCHGRLVI